MSGDETFLESFVESISTLPSEIRRNLGLLKSLDKSCLELTKELRSLEDAYLLRASEIIEQIPVQSRPVEKTDGSRASSAGDGPNTRKRKLEKEKEEVPVKSKGGSGRTRNDASDKNDEMPHNFWADPPQRGVSVTKSDGETVLVLPSTEEFRAQIEDPLTLVKIAKLRRSSRGYAEEKVAVAEQSYSIVNETIKRLDVDLEKFEGLLKGTGQFETVTGAQPDSLAAIQVTPNSPDWILAKVISHETQTGMYKLSDEDIESNKTFTLPESQVVILGGVDRLARGDIIYAVYPDTTSFYQATVVKPPQKVSGGDSFVMVNFKDDGDEHGITHDKAVLMQHIMRVPYGAIQ